MATKPTDGKCVFCGGPIVEKIVQEFNAACGPMMFGPGSRGQFHEVSHGFHCTGCGLKYEFVPTSKQCPTQ